MARRSLNSASTKRKSTTSGARRRKPVASKAKAPIRGLTRGVTSTSASGNTMRGRKAGNAVSHRSGTASRSGAGTTAKRGFASMTPQRRRSIAAKGGRARNRAAA